MSSVLVNNISWHLIYRLIKFGFAFFITTWVARYLGPKKYGALTYAITFAELVMLFWSQGLKEMVIHQYKKNEQNASQVASAAFLLMIIGNLILYAILYVAVTVFVKISMIKVLILICGIGILFRSFEAYELWFHAQLNVSKTIKVQFISQLVFMGCNIFLILSEAKIYWFSVTYSLQLVMAGIGFFIVFKMYKPKKIKVVRNYAIKLILVSSAFMIVAKLFGLFSMMVDRIIIEKLLSIESVGLYTAAMKLITIWLFVSTAISLSYLPLLSDDQFSSNINKTFKKMFNWLATISVILMLFVLLFSESLIDIIFGIDYAESAEILSILSLSIPFVFFNEGIKNWLIIHQYTQYYILSMVLVSLSNIILNILLIPDFGLNGVATAFVLSWIIGGLIIYFVLKETRQLAFLIITSFTFPYHILKSLINSERV